MGLMDREYMNRTPEEREAELHQKHTAKTTDQQKHEQRIAEMYRIMSKGNNMTFLERRRLKQIYKQNQIYMNRTDTYSNHPKKKKSSIIPIVIFTIIILAIVAVFYFYPELANFSF